MLDKVLYGDKGYIGLKSNSYPAYMLRKSKNLLINEYRKQRNKRISSKRAPVERPFSFLKHWKVEHVKTTTILRTKLKMLFACILFNIKQTITLEKQENQIQKENKKENKIINYELSVDISILNGEAQKLRQFIDNLKKRHVLSKKNRKISLYMYKKLKKLEKTNKDKNPNLKTFNIKKLGHTFTKMYL
jgi:hypothetical protein